MLKRMSEQSNELRERVLDLEKLVAKFSSKDEVSGELV